MKVEDVLLYIGAILTIAGGLLLIAGLVLRYVPIGRLPGDIYIKGDGWVVYIPITTMLFVSLLLTLLANVIVYIMRRL